MNEKIIEFYKANKTKVIFAGIVILGVLANFLG